MTEDYLPEPGDKVLLTVHAEMDDRGRYVVRDDRGFKVWTTAIGNSYEVRVEPAPIPVPTDLGTVILATTIDRAEPGRLTLGLADPLSTRRIWRHVGGSDYQPDGIVRVIDVLLPGEPS